MSQQSKNKSRLAPPPWKRFDVGIEGTQGCEFYHKKRRGLSEIFITETDPDTLDWLINFSFVKVRLFKNNKDKALRKLKVHYGYFLYAYMVVNAILRQIQSSKNVVIWGVSAGGAVACIVGALLRVKRPDVLIDVKTYGAPAVGNKAFVQFCKTNLCVTRYVLPIDIVSHSPYWIVGLRHVGHRTHYGVMARRKNSWWKIISNHEYIVRAGHSLAGV